MNIDDLTIGEAKRLVALFGSVASVPPSPFCGRYVIIRTYSAGVHVGVLKSQLGKQVVLEEARRIWSWTGAFTLNEIALTGITGGRVSESVPEIVLTEAIEIIPASKDAERCLRTISAHKP